MVEARLRMEEETLMSMLGTRPSFVKQRSLWYLIPLSWLLLLVMFGVHVLGQVQYLPGKERPDLAYFAAGSMAVFGLMYVLSAETLRAVTEDWGWGARLRVLAFAFLATGAAVALLTSGAGYAAPAAGAVFLAVLFWPAVIGILRSKQ